MGGPYYILPLSVILLAAYFTGVYLVRIGFLGKVIHRKFWNIILLVTFLITAVLGLLLAIQINYKLEWDLFSTLMAWHVNFGIAMSFVGVFHLFWHMTYYLGIFKSKTVRSDLVPAGGEVPVSSPSGPMKRHLIALGFYTTVVQVLLIREIAVVFQGNELMMGWTLGIWMFLTGMGAWAGRSSFSERIAVQINHLIQFLLIVPPILVVLMETGKNVLFVPGELIHPLWFFILIFLLLSPVCILSGFTWSLLVRVQGEGQKSFVRAYYLESLGSMIGGIVVSFLFVRWFSILTSVLIMAFLILLYILSRKGWKPGNLVPIGLTGGIILLMLLYPVDLKMKSFLFYRQKVIESKEGYYGNITVTENGGELSFYENGSLLFQTGDVIPNEEYVHYAMLQRDDVRSVLLVSGGISGMIDEILKYGTVERVDYTELNPLLAELGRRYGRLPDQPKVNLIRGDGRRFLQRSTGHYDMAIFAVPDATSLQLNRFYTAEFMEIVKRHLNNGGVVLFAVSPSGNYLSPEKISGEALIYNTIKKYFRYVVLVPGERDYFVASDSLVSGRIGELAGKRTIQNSYVNQDYLDDRSNEQRSEQILSQIGGLSQFNTDNRPLPVFYHTLRFISRFSGRQLWLLLFPLFLLLLPLWFLNPVSGAMYVTGFSASAIEILLIFWIQATFGYLYSVMGLIFAIFMGGLAMGAIVGLKLEIRRVHFFGAQSLMAFYLLLFPFLWMVSKSSLPGWLIWCLVFAATFLPASVTGFQYVASTVSLDGKGSSAPSVVYAADLWGSALGVMAGTLLFIPVLGVGNTALLLAGINFIAIIVNWIKVR